MHQILTILSKIIKKEKPTSLINTIHHYMLANIKARVQDKPE